MKLPLPYYDDGTVMLYCGDCLEILPALTSGRMVADHAITDPPYEKEAHTKQLRQVASTERKIDHAPLPFAPIGNAARRYVADHLAAAVRRWTLVFCQIEASQRWALDLTAAGSRYIRTAIWRKPNGCPQFTGDRPGMGYETFVACHSDGACRWNGGGRHGVFTHNIIQGQHPTEKPIALMRELVELFTDPGELILDPFAGSGTTLRAAKDCGRRAIGIEINERYCEIAAERLSQEVLAL